MTYLPAAAGKRGALFAIAEGVAPPAAALFHQEVGRELDSDRGTPASSLLRAVRAACVSLQHVDSGRHDLSRFGATVLLVEPGRSGHFRQLCFTQLPPCQAFIADGADFRSVPEEPGWGAGHLTGAADRRWEVELELCRFTVSPGATVLLCTTSMVDGQSDGRLEDMLRQPLAQGGSALLRGRGRSASPLIGRQEALLIRIPQAQAPAPSRLYAVSAIPPSGRVRRPGAATEALAAASGSSTATSNPLRPQIAYWGLRRTRKPGVPILGGLIEHLFTPADVVYAGERRGGSWPAIAVIAAVISLGAAIWLLRPQPLPEAPVIAPSQAPLQGTPLAGRTVLSAGEPFGSLAVAPLTTVPAQAALPAPPGVPLVGYVLDGARGLWSGQITAAGPGGAFGPRRSLPVPADGAPAATEGRGLLANRDGDVLWLDGRRSLWLLPPGGDAPRPVLLRGASIWQRPVAIAAYAGNLYVLDIGASGAPGQIWRHSSTPNGYDADPQPWLAAGLAAALDGVTGMAIDGSIWVSRADGAVLKFGAGRPEPFEISGVQPPLASAGGVYTDRTYRSVYVIDSAARRVIQLSKEGQFERQIKEAFPIGEVPRGLWVDEATGRVLLLTSQRLQELVFPNG